jgi:two-component system NtrC family sensor kinase
MRRRSSTGGEPGRKSVTQKRPSAPMPMRGVRSRSAAVAARQEEEVARLTRERDEALNQLTEALRQQRATADLLKIIGRSTFDLQVVLDTIVETAARLCQADMGAIMTRDGDVYRGVASFAYSPEYTAFWRALRLKPSRSTITGRAALDRRPVHIIDVTADPEYDFPQSVAIGKNRTLLGIPLLRDGEPIGVISFGRRRVEPFTQGQIDLVRSFADQAAIAIENTRLLNELRQRTEDLTESLEQQTATSEVLGVISRSKFELQPILQSVVDTAARLCREAVIAVENVRLFEAEQQRTRELTESLEQQTATSEVLQVIGSSMADATPVFERIVNSIERLFDCRQIAIFLTPGDGLVHMVVGRGIKMESLFAVYRLPIEQTAVPAVLGARQQVYYPDVLNGTNVPQSLRRAAQVIGNFSDVLTPMLWEGRGVGMIAVGREPNTPYNSKELSLLRTFAAQAVIAIENARLLKELRQRTDDLSRSLENLRTAQDRLVQTEKLASLGQLTAGIAHEIKNPLNFVNNFSAVSVELIDELREALGSAHLDNKVRTEISEIADTLQGNLDKVVQHGKRADAIVNNMLLHSRQGSGEHRPVDINALVEESLNLAYHGARAEKQGFNITLERSFDPAAGEVDLFPQEITRALLNLISNGSTRPQSAKPRRMEATTSQPRTLATGSK